MLRSFVSQVWDTYLSILAGLTICLKNQPSNSWITLVPLLRQHPIFHFCCVISWIRDVGGEPEQTHPAREDWRWARVYPELEGPRGAHHHHGLCVTLFPSMFSTSTQNFYSLFSVLLFTAEPVLPQAHQAGPFPGGDVQFVQVDASHKGCNGGERNPFSH